ncbi:MAG TPA: succinate dehydrogenase cytochrome b subunit [Kofleriaceae bacterium]|nr:succinate dehydrogenase cytochrome b subunit [Kofleriaceae bacterium]
MSWLARYLRSSIGAKHVMAVTGLLLLLFAIVHMLGHLQIFGGAAMYDAYARFLQDLWEVKWPVRAGLLGLLVVHVALALMLVARNRAARPTHYAVYRPVVSRKIGRAMAMSGTIVLAFLIFHIWHFTIDGHAHWGAHTYAMYVQAFQQPAYYGAYLVGIALLAAHLGHGASSWLQSLGLRNPKYPTDKLGPIVSALLFVGYMLPPTAILIGAVS